MKKLFSNFIIFICSTCIISCSKEDTNKIELDKLVVKLGIPQKIELKEVENITSIITKDSKLIDIMEIERNHFTLSAFSAGETSIEIIDNLQTTKKVEVAIPMVSYLVERCSYSIKADYESSKLINEDLKSKEFPPYTRITFNRNFRIEILIQEKNTEGEKINGKYEFKKESIFISTNVFELKFNQVNNNENIFFHEDLTKHYQDIYPNFNIKEIIRIYKMEKIIFS